MREMRSRLHPLAIEKPPAFLVDACQEQRRIVKQKTQIYTPQIGGDEIVYFQCNLAITINAMMRRSPADLYDFYVKPSRPSVADAHASNRTAVDMFI